MWGRGNHHRNNIKNLGEQKRGDPGQQPWRPGAGGWRAAEASAQQAGELKACSARWTCGRYTERLLRGVGRVRDSYKAKQANAKEKQLLSTETIISYNKAVINFI